MHPVTHMLIKFHVIRGNQRNPDIYCYLLRNYMILILALGPLAEIKRLRNFDFWVGLTKNEYGTFNLRFITTIVIKKT